MIELPWHRHRPESRHRLIEAGWRKPCTPEGHWLVVCKGEEFTCACGARWVKTERYGLVELEPENLEAA